MRQKLASLLCAIACCAATTTVVASEVRHLEIHVVARPADPGSLLLLSLGFTDHELARPIHDGAYQIPLTLPKEGERFIPPKLVASLSGNLTRLVAFSVDSYFLRDPVAVHFYGADSTTFACHEAVPRSAATAFEIMFRCRDIAVSRERAGLHWTLAHLRALDAWHRANRFMTDRLVDSRGRSPYGLDPELLPRLAELRRLVEEDGFDAARFRPVRYPDVLDTLRMHEQAGIALAGWTEELIAQNRLEDAQRVNAIAIEALEEVIAADAISGAAIDQRVSGTSLRILRNDAAYIHTLRSRM
jgi:hypothetical protein